MSSTRNSALADPANESVASGRRRFIPRLRGRERGRIWRRLLNGFGKNQETGTTDHSMLPTLIEVFAGFTKLDGVVEADEIDSILGFLRYDFPESVYTELRSHFMTSLRQRQDLEAIAADLATTLDVEEKVLLGVQLYVLISRAGLPKESLITYYQFMTTLGVASEAISIVYQLNSSEATQDASLEFSGDQGVEDKVTHRLESLLFSTEDNADVHVQAKDEHSVSVFRFLNLILVKNLGPGPILARGRQVNTGEFYRIYEGQRILIGEEDLTFEDLIFYFNSKKNVSSVQVYLAQDSGGGQFIERVRTKQSYLRVSFGLKIDVEVLNETGASIAGEPLSKGSAFEVSAQEKIEFDDHTEITFAELRKKARELGGRFSLPPNRTEYLVSNDPSLLSDGDILLTPGAAGTILLRIRCDYGAKTGVLDVLESERVIAVENEPVRKSVNLKDGDIISLGDGQFLCCHFSEGIIEEERNVIHTLKIRDAGHSYDRKVRALDGVTFSIQRGEMVCVMGPSGCGKSTLLKVLGGQLKPSEGRVDLNGVDLYAEHDHLKSYIGFIPQEETFDPLLTVEENLDTAAAIRAPHFSPHERRRRADSKLIELGLNEIRHRLAGDHETKSLSGGQRRRLNAGMDMIGIADIYLFDEPTSGLSSKDSEHVLDIIRGLTHNKITLVSIHQPSSRLFHMFDKAILLDNGGKLAFFGTPEQMLDYFNEARKQEGIFTSTFASPDDAQADTVDVTPSKLLPPDFVFDVLETPLRDLSGEVIYERDARGNLIPARRFNSAFWSDRFQTYRLLEEVNLREIEADTSSQTGTLQKTPQAPPRTLRHDWVRFCNQFKRAFLSKLRNRANLAITLLVAPILALLLAIALHYTEEIDYNFRNAFHIPKYLFLSLVIALFLGLTNSAEEIIRDRNLLQRERHHGFRVSGYILCKYLSLGFFSLIQCVIYLLIANAILDVRSMFFHDLLWMFSTSFVGVAAGLFISSVVNSPKTALNIIPLVLIPNIIFGGALIKYEEMNRGVDLVQNVRNWLSPNRQADEISDLKVPSICNLMPLRWSYEGMIIAHADRNPASQLNNEINAGMQKFASIPLSQKLTAEQKDELNQYKQALAVVHGLEAEKPSGVGKQLREIRKSLNSQTFDPAKYYSEFPEETITYSAEQLYLNKEVQLMFTKAEAERQDYRKEANPPNIFFGSEKYFRFPSRSENPWVSFQLKTLHLNLFAMLAFIAGAFVALYISLKKQLRKV